MLAVRSTLVQADKGAGSGRKRGKEAHDILNQLHATHGFLELLRTERAGVLNDTQRRYLAIAIESLDNCVHGMRRAADRPHEYTSR